MFSIYHQIQQVDTSIIVGMMQDGQSNSAIITALHSANAARDPRIRKYIATIRDNHCTDVRRHRHAYTLDDVRIAVKQALCMSDVLRTIGLSTHGGNSSTIQRLIDEHSIDTSHFNVQLCRNRHQTKWTVDNVFVESSLVPRPTLCQYVKRFNVLKYECEGCQNDGTWKGQPLTLTVDHKNGISDDNRIQNLRYLCPNCHAQTDTFGNKNRTAK